MSDENGSAACSLLVDTNCKRSQTVRSCKCTAETEGHSIIMALEGKEVTSNDLISSREDHDVILAPLEGEQQRLPYPKAILFIISFQFFDHFTYHGMRTVLVLYLTQKLKFDKDSATVIYHLFSAVTHFMCIFGGIISDSFLGKFKTILYFSLVFALGNVFVALGAIPPLNILEIATGIGLCLVIFGTGIARTCIAAFGGDQFRLPAQSAQIVSFFSIYSFSSNLASVVATIITPILRQDVQCFDENDCFSLAFGVPAALMIIAIIILVSGKPLYKLNPPSDNVVVQVTQCIKNAIITRGVEKDTEPRKHWLDYSEEKFGKQLVDDTKTFLKVLVLFIPFPFYWSLTTQHGSRWTLQAVNMDGNIGIFKIKPDQMHVVKPLMKLMFIPVFDTMIYPILTKIGIRRPLQKMSIGFFLTALTFVISGFVELELSKTYSIQPTEGQAQLRFISGLPCNFTVNTNIPSKEQFELDQFKMFEEKYIEAWSPTAYEFTLTSNDTKCAKPIGGRIVFNSQTATTVFVSGQEIKEEDVYTDSSQRAKSPMLRVLFSSLGDALLHEVKIVTPSNNNRVAFDGLSSDRRLFSISSAVHAVYIDGQNYGTIELKDGSVSTLIVLETPNEERKFHLHLVEITAPTSMSMLWQLPQYIVLTVTGVMVNITGLGFWYAQAPASMKTVVHACWSMTDALGNIIVMIVAGARLFDSQALEFFSFAGLMVINALLFILLAKNFKPLRN